MFEPDVSGRDKVVISVVDQGRGMNALEIEETRMMFKTGQSKTSSKLGLVISNEIVKALGGKMNVYSNEKQGSQFTFSVLLELESQMTISHESVSLSEVKPTLQKILVVDSDQHNLDIYGMFFMILQLDNMHERVTFCQNGLQAIDVIKQSIANGNPLEYGLVITDCHIPFCDGFMLTKTLRQEWSKVGVN